MVRISPPKASNSFARISELEINLMSDPLFSVADQVVVVSGGSRGIGKSIAAGFAQRAKHVIVTGRNEEVLQKTKAEIQVNPDTVSTAICDVS